MILGLQQGTGHLHFVLGQTGQLIETSLVAKQFN